MKKKNKEAVPAVRQVQSINCQQAVARFNDFMDNYLKSKTREELLKHLSECKDCMDRFEFEQLIKSRVHQLSGAEDPAIKEKIEKLIASL
jgi:hypothetical protein